MLGADETIDAEGIAGRPIFIIRGPDGQPTGVRKVARGSDDRPGYFDATRNEARIYKQIIAENPESWRDHLLPYRNSAANSASVIIDFDWVDGVDVRSYLADHPQDASAVFDHVARQLRWLAEKGYAHGDIDAGNFFRTADGRILILDLGLAHKRIVGAQKEKNDFIHMIRPYIKPKVGLYLDSKPLTTPLVDFFLSASRQIRKSTRRSTQKRRGTQRRRTLST
jgi:serine/threonine protein kinase